MDEKSDDANSDEEVKEQVNKDQRETQISYDELLVQMKSIEAEIQSLKNENTGLKADIESSK